MSRTTEPQARLRPVGDGDAPAVLAAFATPGMERQGEVTDLESAQEWVHWATGADRHVFAVDIGGVLGGAVGVSNIDLNNRVGWFWYWLHAEFRGRGLASRAAATVATWALTDGGLHRLELGHRRNNPSSGKVALAAGFTLEGCEREKFEIDGERVDVLTYGRLATDPRPSTAVLPLQR